MGVEYQVVAVFDGGFVSPRAPRTDDEAEALETFEEQASVASYRTTMVRLMRREGDGPWEVVKSQKRPDAIPEESLV